MKVLNLYAGIGGNRKLWPKECKVVAVENNPQIAKIYQESFPNDKVIICDAHKLLTTCWDKIKEFDFIWSSPPCPSHSRTNFFLKAKGIIRYPDMRLYEEIIFLNYFPDYYKVKWVVENVISYYNPLIKPKQIGRHYFWSNFRIINIKLPKDEIGKMCGKNQKAHNKPLEKRNMVNPKLGLHIFNCAFKEKQETLE